MNKRRRLSVIVSIIDFVSIVLSWLLGSLVYLVLFKENKVFFEENFFQSLIILIVSYILAEILTNKKNSLFLERTGTEELNNSIKLTFIIGIIFATLTFLTKQSIEVSRGVYLLSLTINLLLLVLSRNVVKSLIKKNFGKIKARMIIVTTSKKAKDSDLLLAVQNNSLSEVIGLVLIDENQKGNVLGGIPVIENFNELTTYIKLEIVDSVLFVLDNGWWDSAEETIETIHSTGVIIHLGVELLTKYSDLNRTINYIGNYPVFSVAQSIQSDEQLIVKRIFDILGGLVGSIIALVVAAVLAPIIKLESDGPVFFKQQRVGKNGRYFNIYKFRSMGIDAEEKKKGLKSENEMDGLMFKMTNDPRVTKVGKFIRATSIDELPQFFNVLNGDMSLVGTRPPTVDEYKEYKAHHKRRLSMKPGITGMWQVSGRSNITDFEEVVRLDTEYIDNYSLILDIKIILKTFIVVIGKIGSK